MSQPEGSPEICFVFSKCDNTFFFLPQMMRCSQTPSKSKNIQAGSSMKLKERWVSNTKLDVWAWSDSGGLSLHMVGLHNEQDILPVHPVRGSAGPHFSKNV